jgi:hypothetical protein
MTYHDGFQVLDHSKKGKPGSGSGHCVPATGSANVCQCWTHAMVGTSICPICHRNKLPCHVPTQCPLLAKLNLKRIRCHPVASSPSSSTQHQHPLPSPVPAPIPGGPGEVTDASSATGSLGSSSAPSGLTAQLLLWCLLPATLTQMTNIIGKVMTLGWSMLPPLM